MQILNHTVRMHPEDAQFYHDLMEANDIDFCEMMDHISYEQYCKQIEMIRRFIIMSLPLPDYIRVLNNDELRMLDLARENKKKWTMNHVMKSISDSQVDIIFLTMIRGDIQYY